jgi:hypothetical protein
VQEARDKATPGNELFWTPLDDPSRQLVADSEDNLPSLQPEGRLVTEMEREAFSAKPSALLRGMEISELDYSHLPNPQEGPPSLGHMKKVRKVSA